MTRVCDSCVPRKVAVLKAVTVEGVERGTRSLYHLLARSTSRDYGSCLPVRPTGVKSPVNLALLGFVKQLLMGRLGVWIASLDRLVLHAS